MPGNSQSGTQTQTQNAQPWDAQAPYLKNIFQQAEGLYQNGGPQYYPGQMTAPLAPETLQAWAQQGQRAQDGSPLVGAAKDNILTTLNGGNQNQELGGLRTTAQNGGGVNPYADQAYNAASNAVTRTFNDKVVPGVAGHFLSNGRFGSGAMKNGLVDATNDLTSNLAGLAAGIYGPAYENQAARASSAQGQLAGYGENAVNRGFSAAQFAPQLAANDYNDIAALNAVGTARQGYGQQQIGENVNRYNYGQQQPANNLARFLQFIQGNYGGTSTQSQPTYSNPAAGALGGALVGGQFLGPWGALGGAGLGLLAA